MNCVYVQFYERKGCIKFTVKYQTKYRLCKQIIAEIDAISMAIMPINGATLTLILLGPKVISLCQQYRARPACTFM